MKEITKLISSPEEMFQFGVELAHELRRPHLVLALKGDLGAGKTTFLKGFISTLTHLDPQAIQSPTFTYLQEYEGTIPVYHFDLYRLKNASQFESAGFSDYLKAGGICCLEWAERIDTLLPETCYILEIAYHGPQARECSLYQKGNA